MLDCGGCGVALVDGYGGKRLLYLRLVCVLNHPRVYAWHSQPTLLYVQFLVRTDSKDWLHWVSQGAPAPRAPFEAPFDGLEMVVGARPTTLSAAPGQSFTPSAAFLSPVFCANTGPES